MSLRENLLYIDMNKRNYQFAKFVQYDNNVPFVAHILKNGIDANLSGYKAAAYIKTGSGTFQRNCAISGSQLSFVLDNTILNSAGEAYAEITLYKGEVEESTFTIKFTIDKSVKGVTVEEIPDWDIVKKMLDLDNTTLKPFMDKLLERFNKLSPEQQSNVEVQLARGEYDSLSERLSENDSNMRSLFDYTRSIESANASNILKITNYLGNHQNIHPKVLHFPQKLWGYKFWMAYTPYPNGDTKAENPCIAVSNDMINWEVPKGLINPLDNTPHGGYNSDTHLLYREDTNTLEIWWRQVVDGTRTFFRRTSKDGTSWTAKELVKSVRYAGEMLSPCVVFDEGKYKVWFCRRREGKDDYVMYCESIGDTVSEWTDDIALKIDWDTLNLRAWHLDVIKTEKGYEMAVCAYDRDNGESTTGDLFYVLQKFDGSFTKPFPIIQRSNNPEAFDNHGIYRSSILKIDNKYYVFYSCIDKNTNRWMSLSFGDTPFALNGYKDTKGLNYGSKYVSVPMFPGHDNLTNFNVSNVDTILCSKDTVVNGFAGGYLGKKVTVIAIGSNTRVTLKNSPSLLLAAGKDEVLNYHTRPSVEIICTNTDGSEWRVMNQNFKPGGQYVSVPMFPGHDNLTDFDVSDVETVICSKDTVVNSFKGGYLGKKITIATIGSSTRVTLNNNSRLILANGATEVLNYHTRPIVEIICTSTDGSEWRVMNQNFNRMLTVSAGNSIAGFDTSYCDTIQLTGNGTVEVNSLKATHVGQKITIILGSSSVSASMKYSSRLILPGLSDFTLDKTKLGMQLVCTSLEDGGVFRAF